MKLLFHLLIGSSAILSVAATPVDVSAGNNGEADPSMSNSARRGGNKVHGLRGGGNKVRGMQSSGWYIDYNKKRCESGIPLHGSSPSYSSYVACCVALNNGKDTSGCYKQTVVSEPTDAFLTNSVGFIENEMDEASSSIESLTSSIESLSTAMDVLRTTDTDLSTKLEEATETVSDQLATLDTRVESLEQNTESEEATETVSDQLATLDIRVESLEQNAPHGFHSPEATSDRIDLPYMEPVQVEVGGCNTGEFMLSCGCALDLENWDPTISPFLNLIGCRPVPRTVDYSWSCEVTVGLVVPLPPQEGLTFAVKTSSVCATINPPDFTTTSSTPDWD